MERGKESILYIAENAIGKHPKKCPRKKDNHLLLLTQVSYAETPTTDTNPSPIHSQPNPTDPIPSHPPISKKMKP